MSDNDKTKLAIVGIIINSGVLLLMSAFIMWIWNWVQPVEYILTYWKTVGSLYILRLFYSTMTYNYFKTDEYKEKIKNG